MKFLQNHPFAVEACFKRSLVLTYAVPKQELEHLLPPCLTLDTYQDTWGFIAVAMVDTNGLRPKGFPRFMGNNFFLIGYRIFVRYTNSSGKRLRGLYIIKSETNKKKMEVLGNVFTQYNYTTTDIQQSFEGNCETLFSHKSGFKVELEMGDSAIELPLHSPFDSWKSARRYAGPLPFTFTYNEDERSVLIIEGVRQNWEPTPVKVMSHQFELLDKLNLTGVVLANAFEICDVPYYWKKGIKELWR